MSSSEKQPAQSANALPITRPSPSRNPSNQSTNVLTIIEDVESTHSLSPTHSFTRNEKSLERESSPFSPFYNPTPTRHSLEKAKSESRQNINVISPNHYDIDIESLALQKTANTTGKMSLLKSKSRRELECQAWPGHSELRQKKQQMRRQRGKDLMCCGWMTGLDRKTKLWIKILIAFLIVGIAVGVGVGISKAVGGGIWKNKNNPNAPIDH